jgi:4-hydroxybenzoate polyprenyltransferase
MTLTERLTHYEKLMRLDKPIGILLLLWPTLWALWIAAEGVPNWMLAWIFIFGTVLMRSAGCVINDYADRAFDPHVKRTKDRPLAAGAVSEREALILFVVLVICSGLLILGLSLLVWVLAVAAVFLAASYPFTKRFFAIPQAYLGIAFGFGIPMAFAATLGELPMVAWVLLAANIFWAIAYDTEYAMVDRDDDIRIGIRTSALTFGRHDVLAVMLCYAFVLGILSVVGLQIERGPWYFAGLAIAAGIMGFHYTLIRGRDRQKCFKAFLHNNWVGAAIFAGIALDYWLRGPSAGA